MSVSINKISVKDTVKIFGHSFNGLDAIAKAVEAYSRILEGFGGRRDSGRKEPQEAVPGVHVLLVYEPYPCFDSYDYMYEKRRYCNYFFSEKAFTDADIDRLASMPHVGNCRLVTEDMDRKALPAVYYVGDGDTMLVTDGIITE